MTSCKKSQKHSNALGVSFFLHKGTKQFKKIPLNILKQSEHKKTHNRQTEKTAYMIKMKM